MVGENVPDIDTHECILESIKYLYNAKTQLDFAIDDMKKLSNDVTYENARDVLNKAERILSSFLYIASIPSGSIFRCNIITSAREL